MFAKIFETEEHGQILVKVDQGPECEPEVRFFFEPKELGVCSMAISFTDSEAGWKSADELFKKVDAESAISTVKGIKEQLDLK